MNVQYAIKSSLIVFRNFINVKKLTMLEFVMTCRGICERYKSEKKRYQSGTKRCTSCNIYIDYQDRMCPCCGTQLRAKRKF